MKKINYNFRKQSNRCLPVFQDVLDTVIHVISPYQRLDCSVSECRVIKHFDNDLFVGYPPHALGNVKFYTYYHDTCDGTWTGTMHLGIDGTYPRYFRLENNVLYIGKSTYDEY